MKHLTTIFTLFFAAIARAIPWLQTRANDTNTAWTVDQFKNFVVFGDSYSDENRFNYFLQHDGSAPPTGTLLPEQLHAATGGRVWARYVVQYTNEALTLYNYAVDGAACSNQITPRVFNATVPFYPDIDGYEIPAFLADKAKDINVDSGGPYFDPAITDENAVYTIFIGTNDITIGSIFTDSQTPGKTLSDVVDCIYDQMDRIYASGGRYIVLFNIVPLQLTALFGNATEGGEAPSYFWTDKPSNLTDVSERMTEYTTSLNTIFDYRTPVEVLLNNRYPGAKIAMFDVNRIILDVHNNPSVYLNGTPPLHPTGYIYQCNLQREDCVAQPSPDSWAWYDPSHPSEQVSRIIAKNFVDLLGGKSEYATYYECDE